MCFSIGTFLGIFFLGAFSCYPLVSFLACLFPSKIQGASKKRIPLLSGLGCEFSYSKSKKKTLGVILFKKKQKMDQKRGTVTRGGRIYTQAPIYFQRKHSYLIDINLNFATICL
jgi:hypothetical protein